MQMHEGWFSAFRDDFGPTSYGNGGHFSINFRLFICFLIFIVPYLAFLVVLPGVREKRFATFLTLTLHLTVGALLTAGLVLPYWSTGHTVVLAHFQTHSRYRHEANVGVYVGLNSMNITLKYIRTDGSDKRFYDGLDLNERYDLNGVSSMATELQAAYREGKPYPILKMLEYFSLNQGAFEWGRRYRSGGHYTFSLIWTALAIWILQCALLAFLPHYYSKAGVLCGIFIFLADVIYVILSPSDPSIPFAAARGGTTHLHMHYGVCFYMSIVAGLISILFSGTLCALQFLRVYSLSTCLSSYLDESVGPRCRKGRSAEEKTEFGVSSAASETSTYISDETVSHDTRAKHRAGRDRSHDPSVTNYRKRSTPSEPNPKTGSSGFQSRSSLRSLSSFSGSRDSIAFERTMSNATVDELEPMPRRGSHRAVL